MTVRGHARFIMGLALSFASFVIGAATGAVITRMTSSGMGWDQLGDVLGGIAIGAVVGVLGAVLFARGARPALLRGVTITALAVAGVILIFLSMRARAG